MGYFLNLRFLLVMQTLFYFFTAIVASIIAVKLTSTYLKAGKHDWLSSTITVVLSLVLLTTVNNILPIALLGISVSILVVGFMVESVLETTFINAMFIAAAAVLVQCAVAFGFDFLGVNTDMLSFIQQFLSAVK